MQNVRNHCYYTGKYRGAAHSNCNLNYKIPKEIPVVFHNGSTYDYHFIIKQLARKVKGNFDCLGENTEVYITFSAPIKKENDNGKTTTYKLKFIDSYRFMQDSLSNLVDNLSDINNKMSYASLIEKFPNTYQLFNNDLNIFDLLLRKVFIPMNTWIAGKNLKKNHYLTKNLFTVLNNEHITDEDYAHAQKVWNTFNIKTLGEYHDLYVQSGTLLLADVFEHFIDKCIEIYELDPAHFLSAPGLAWQACLKKTQVKLELLTDNNMLLMFEKGIRGGMCQVSHHYAKANNKYLKNYDKNIESSYIEYLDANNLYGWAMCKKLPIRDFKWLDNLSMFTEELIKNYNENGDKGYIFEVHVEYPNKLGSVYSDLPFLLKE